MTCYPSIVMTVLSPARNLLPFLSPYIDAINIVPYTEAIVILSLTNSKTAAKK